MKKQLDGAYDIDWIVAMENELWDQESQSKDLEKEIQSLQKMNELQ